MKNRILGRIETLKEHLEAKEAELRATINTPSDHGGTSTNYALARQLCDQIIIALNLIAELQRQF